MIAIAAASFLILYGISYTFITSQFSVSFPKVFEILGSAFLGFLAGFLVWSFASLLILITPISQNSLVKEMGFSRSQSEQSNAYICSWCNLVNKVAALEGNKYTAKEAISELLKSAEVKSPAKTKTTEQAIPKEPAKPNGLESTTRKKEPPCPPSDANNI